MKLKITKEFRDEPNKQEDFMVQDKPLAARKFKNDIIRKISEIPNVPFKTENPSSLIEWISEI